MKTFKNYKIVLSFIICGLSLSCDNFTEVDMPQSQITGSEVYKDISTATAALSDIYARMREGGVVSGTQGGATCLLASYADDMTFYGENPDIEQFNNHTILASNSINLGLWNTTYEQIYALNSFIDGMNHSTAILGVARDQLLGEAIFLRAYFYFYLVNIYGDIPYVTSTDYQVNSKISKMVEAEIYENILSDLLIAETYISEEYPSTDRVRPNNSTVKALLARVNLYAKNYDLAAQYASSVISNSLYVWQSDPASIFLKDCPSTIWSVHPGIPGMNTKDARSFIFSVGPPFKPALSVNLLNAFETGDLRKSLWIRTITSGSQSWNHSYKYKKNGITTSSEEYTVLFRLEEQYLIRAEAEAMNNNIFQAQQDLDKIRIRAGLSNTTANSKASLLLAILQERRVEFFSEQSHRWFDLKRTATASSALSGIKAGWKETDVLLPIPENEILLNPNLLPQNPGY
ncbi:MAG: RagB/SusD family nutrient uptake outer membrane protein [Candidatus Saccharimonadaceae bacterium]